MIHDYIAAALEVGPLGLVVVAVFVLAVTAITARR